MDLAPSQREYNKHVKEPKKYPTPGKVTGGGKWKFQQQDGGKTSIEVFVNKKDSQDTLRSTITPPFDNTLDHGVNGKLNDFRKGLSRTMSNFAAPSRVDNFSKTMSNFAATYSENALSKTMSSFNLVNQPA
jgi:hypothetical protein